MGRKVLKTCVLFLLPLLVSLASLLPTGLRVQTCTLNTPLPSAIVDAAPSTRKDTNEGPLTLA
jgi:hypothetical protein